MKRNRLEQVFSYIKEHENASTLELAEFFHVSEMTIRRDLAELEANGRVARFYGGAMAKQPAPAEDAFSLRVGINLKYKNVIGARAVQYLQEHLAEEENAAIFFGSGSSIFLMAQQLKEVLPMPAVTDNLHVASVLASNPENSVVMIGGTILLPSLNATGYLAEKMLADLSIECAFIGSSGIDKNGYLCAYNFVETGMFSTIISVSKQVVILADHSKIGHSNMVRISRLNNKFTLITDQLAPQKCVEYYRQLGTKVLLVECNE